MRIMVAGDTHGNTSFVTNYLYEKAVEQGCVQIIQLGDFGYWTHTEGGREFLDAVSKAAVETAIPLYWLHGNHDKHSLALQVTKQRTVEGFIEVAPSVFYIPQGASWQWQDGHMRPYSLDNANAVTCRAFGGAYSIDKAWRLGEEQKNFASKLRVERYRTTEAGLSSRVVESQAGTLWFPEEEMSDAEMEELLAADSRPRTVVFSHDKPRSTNPGMTLKDIPECHFNQDRLQRALLAHQPKLWLHGHLHKRYVHTVRCGDDKATTVLGLSCDDNASYEKPAYSWALLDVDGPTVTPTLGGTETATLEGFAAPVAD